MQRKILKNRLLIHGPTKDIVLDLYLFAKHILGYSNMGQEHQKWSDDLFNALLINRNHKLVFLKPRGTYKSSFYTISLPIWVHIMNPDLRILIANAIAGNAENFLSEIVGHYLRNDRLRQLYQQIGMDNTPVDPHSSLKTRLNLTNCDKIQKEPSISITGYGSSIVSQHYDIIIVDDLCDRSDRESDMVREDKKRWFSDLASLLEPDGVLLVIGTRWHFSDCYSYIIDDLNPKHKPEDKYYIEVEGCYIEDNAGIQQARYPRILSLDKLEELKIDKTMPEFAANYLNDPLPAEAQIFKLSDMTFFDIKTVRDLKRTYGFCDPSLGKKKGDYGALITATVGDNGVIYIIDALIEKMSPNKAIELIMQKIRRYKYRMLGIENNGFQDLFVDNIKDDVRSENMYVDIIGINHSTNKQGRIEAIQPMTYTSPNRPARVQFRSDWESAYPLLMKQLTKFPLSSEHDDAPDALEGVIQLIKESVIEVEEPFVMGGAAY